MVALLLSSSFVLGGLSLLAFFVALYAGPFELVPLGLGHEAALLWDAGLCALFFAQHSLMVRQGFRESLGRRMDPRFHPALYSAASGAALLLLVGLWQGSGDPLVSAEGASRLALRVSFVASTLLFAWTLKSLEGFDPFGSRALRAPSEALEDDRLVVRGPYRWVRHPLYASFLVMVWSSPDLTADRLLFSLSFTGWLVVGTLLEERDLVRRFGDAYRRYQATVPMFIPWRPPVATVSGGVR